MKLYKCTYQSIEREGVKYLFASNTNEAEKKLQAKNLLPVRVEEVNIFMRLNYSRDYELMNIFWQLGFGFGSGLNILVILESIKSGLHYKENITLLDSMLVALNGGDPISKALKQHANLCGDLIVALFEIGEKSGKMQEICELCTTELQQKNDFTHTMRKALIYPSILGFALLCVFVIIAVFVIPEFAQIYMELDAELPLSTQGILIISSFINNYYIEIFISIFMITFVIKMLFAKKAIQDKIILQIPILNQIVLDYELYRYFLGLHYFLQSRVPFDKSVVYCNNFMGNMYIKDKFSSVFHILHNGYPLSYALQEINLNIANLALLKSGEKSGSLDKALFINAEFYKKRYKQTLQTLNILVEPIATIIMGLFVSWLAFSVVSPMWKLLEVAI
ncbi:type II secretion system F family protein [Helicobacter didelphidarum]|uniref:Type II secretion system F family protein n=1 Tax=Helicobacter didelphidarum TaxID=2040648 RepID=A0A3D8IK39_9HELI|nr:type II secretion system F family protein [Helicobacter didelphidarum]RDU65717.1 type II secretion system F family protein [Helicobacter didelphidarum]